MGIDDVADGRSVLAAGVTAAVLSPRVRGVLRRGAVYGVAGALKASDVVAGAARGAARGVRGDEEPGGAAEAAPVTGTAPQPGAT